jgi:hypothetical protein
MCSITHLNVSIIFERCCVCPLTASSAATQWKDQCSASTLSIREEEAMNFGTNGQKEDDEHKKGRKQRDDVFARYEHLFFATEKSTWGNQPTVYKLLNSVVC